MIFENCGRIAQLGTIFKYHYISILFIKEVSPTNEVNVPVGPLCRFFFPTFPGIPNPLGRLKSSYGRPNPVVQPVGVAPVFFYASVDIRAIVQVHSLRERLFQPHVNQRHSLHI